MAKTRKKKPITSIDDELLSTATELKAAADPDVVEEVEEEIRAEIRREIRERMRRSVEARNPRKPKKVTEAEPEEEFVRFSLVFRLQHLLLMASCVVLIITGLPLKFPDTRIADFFFRVVGGVGVSGSIHRVGAVGLICVGVFHILFIGLTEEGQRNFRALLPKPKDVVDVYQNVRFFLGRARHGARFGRFSYIEKFDYWAVYWGIVVMITSGLMLWGQDIAMRILPKFALDMAQEAHSDEALLATLAIIIWHMYNVHLNPDHFPMNRTFLTGRVSKTHMMHHHPLEYEQLISERGDKGKNGKRGRAKAPKQEDVQVEQVKDSEA